MHQMRAALANESAVALTELQPCSMVRHVWMRIAYDTRTTTADATIAPQLKRVSSGWSRNALHCATSVRPMKNRTSAATISCAARKTLRGGARNRSAIDVDVLARHRFRRERRKRVHSPCYT